MKLYCCGNRCPCRTFSCLLLQLWAIVSKLLATKGYSGYWNTFISIFFLFSFPSEQSFDIRQLLGFDYNKDYLPSSPALQCVIISRVNTCHRQEFKLLFIAPNQVWFYYLYRKQHLCWPTCRNRWNLILMGIVIKSIASLMGACYIYVVALN